MGRFLRVTLDDQKRAELEDSYRHDKSHTFRQHCQIVLLKAEGRKSNEIAAIFGCCQKSVNDWLHRYLSEGITGLRTKPGRGTTQHPIRSSRRRACARGSNGAPPTHLARQSHARSGFRQRVFTKNAGAVLSKLNCRYKRLRKRVKGAEAAEIYQLKREILGELETLSESRKIDLY